MAKVLVVAAPLTIRIAEEALDGHVQLLCSTDMAQALSLLDEERPRLVIVGYHFQEVRELLLKIRKRVRGTRIFLLRAMGLPLGDAMAEQIRTAYETYGVEEFVSLYDDERRMGREAALEHLRKLVLRHLPRE